MKKKIKQLEKEKIALLGLGLENQSLLFFLLKHSKNLDICICDYRSRQDLEKKFPELKKEKNLKWQNETNFNLDLNKFSILFRSPGWPLKCPGVQKALKNRVKVSSPMNFFLEICPNKNIIAVSGTKGKGTTASLIYQAIKNSGKSCFLGGNIGVAPLSFIDKIKKESWIVLELSSFQLEDLKIKPKIALITNFFKEHLSPADPANPNYHRNLKSYWEAKLNISRQQKKDDLLIINKKLENKIKAQSLLAKIIFFTKSKYPTQLVGDFNQENIAAAEAVAEALKISKKIFKETVAKFSNLEHRLELVRTWKKVNYYNNSFATTPESSTLDLKSFKKNIILLAGGADKGSSFKNFAAEIKKRVKFLVLFPGLGSEKIKEELDKIKFKNIFWAKSMSEAVRRSTQEAQEQDTILLSTACASFGLFKNYKERGELFKKEVNNLK